MMRLKSSCFAAMSALGSILCAAVVAQPANAQTTKSAEQSVVKVNMVRGFITLYVNGQSLGKVEQQGVIKDAGKGLKDIPLAKYVKPGANTLKIVWEGDKAPVGGISVGYAPPGAAMRQLADIQLNPVNAKPTGSRSVVFNLPKSGTNQSVAAGTSSAGTVAPGSHPNQTLLIANIVNGSTVDVTVNGKKVGTFSGGYVPLDVSDYVKFGANDVRLQWEAQAPTGEVKVSYAVRPSQFRTLSSFALNPVTTKSGTKTRSVSFNLPKPK